MSGRPLEWMYLELRQGNWTAYEGIWDDSEGSFRARQAVFRTQENILQDGAHHSWQCNRNASSEEFPHGPPAPEWEGTLRCQTQGLIRSLGAAPGLTN